MDLYNYGPDRIWLLLYQQLAVSGGASRSTADWCLPRLWLHHRGESTVVCSQNLTGNQTGTGPNLWHQQSPVWPQETLYGGNIHATTVTQITMETAAGLRLYRVAAVRGQAFCRGTGRFGRCSTPTGQNQTRCVDRGCRCSAIARTGPEQAGSARPLQTGPARTEEDRSRSASAQTQGLTHRKWCQSTKNTVHFNCMYNNYNVIITFSLSHSSILQLRKVTKEEVDEILSNHALKLKLWDIILKTHANKSAAVMC